MRNDATESPPIGSWALALGAVGFACGFFGPIALNPGANQGPLLGLFITGPGGVAFGLFAGLIARILDAEVRGCESPEDAAEAATARWEKRIAAW